MKRLIFCHNTYLVQELAFIRSSKLGSSNPAVASLIKTYTKDDLQTVADCLAQLPAPERR